MRAVIYKATETPNDSRDAWRALQSADSIFDSPFFSPEFAAAIGVARGDAYVAEIVDGGRSVAFFPHHRRPRGVAKPIGAQISDYHGLIASKDFGAEPGELLAACGLSAYDYNHLPVGAAVFAMGAAETSRSPRMNLACGYETWARARAAETDLVKTAERKARKLAREVGEVEFRFDDDRAEAWEAFIRLKNANFAAQGLAVDVMAGWTGQALRSLRATKTPHFAGVLSTLSAGGTIISAHFGLSAGGVLAWWYNGYDESYGGYSPGVLLILAIAKAGAGVSIIDFGRGEQRYKLSLANEHRALCEGSVAAQGSLAWWLRAGQKPLLRAAERLPHGRMEDFARRALVRLVTAVRLPDESRRVAS